MSVSPSQNYLSNAAAQAAARVLSMVGSLASILLVARVLGVTAFGQVAYVTTFVMLAGALADLGTNVALAHGLAAEKESDAAGYFGNFLLLRAALALLATALALLLAWWLRPDLMLLLAIGCVAVPFVGARFFESVYQIFGKPLYTLYASVLLTAVQLSAAAAVLLFDGDVVAYVAGFAFAQVVFFCFAFALAWRINRPRFELQRDTLRTIVVMATPMGLWSLFNAIGTRSDVFIIGNLLSLDEVGIYNAATRLLDIGTTFVATAVLPLIPLLTTRHRLKPSTLPSVAQDLFLITAVLALPLPVLAGYLAAPVVTLVYGAGFAASAPLLALFGWTLLFLSITYLASALNVAVGNVRYQSWSAALCAALNIALNLLLVPRHGALGAVWAGITSGAVMAAISVYCVVTRIDIDFAWRRWARLTLALAGLALTPWLLHDAGLVWRLAAATIVYAGLLWGLKVIPADYRSRLRPRSAQARTIDNP
jgi:O-antigen/teichoic acid export membrane protein